MNELIKIDPKEYGLEETQVSTIEQAFLPKVAERDGYAIIYGELITKELTPELCKEARELRLKLVKTRTGIADIHKKQKAFFLAAGKFVDAWKNKETAPIEQMEEKLSDIEKYFENLEKERIEKIAADRKEKLAKYEVTEFPAGLGQMNDATWNAFLIGTRINWEEKKEAERKAEEGRIENERLDKLASDRFVQVLPLKQFWLKESYDFRSMTDEDFTLLRSDLQKCKDKYEAEQLAIRKENERLRKEAEAKEAARKAEEAQRRIDEQARIEKEESEHKAREEKERKERAEYEAKLKAAQEEKERIEAELKSKQEAEIKAAQEKKEAEEKAERERIAAERKAAKAPDKDKLKNAIESCSLELPVCKTKEAEIIAEEINTKFAAFKKWADGRIETI